VQTKKIPGQVTAPRHPGNLPVTNIAGPFASFPTFVMSVNLAQAVGHKEADQPVRDDSLEQRTCLNAYTGIVEPAGSAPVCARHWCEEGGFLAHLRCVLEDIIWSVSYGFLELGMLCRWNRFRPFR
jgi:hypothetical protein